MTTTMTTATGAIRLAGCEMPTVPGTALPPGWVWTGWEGSIVRAATGDCTAADLVELWRWMAGQHDRAARVATEYAADWRRRSTESTTPVPAEEAERRGAVSGLRAGYCRRAADLLDQAVRGGVDLSPSAIGDICSQAEADTLASH